MPSTRPSSTANSRCHPQACETEQGGVRLGRRLVLFWQARDMTDTLFVGERHALPPQARLLLCRHPTVRACRHHGFAPIANVHGIIRAAPIPYVGLLFAANGADEARAFDSIQIGGSKSAIAHWAAQEFFRFSHIAAGLASAENESSEQERHEARGQDTPRRLTPPYAFPHDETLPRTDIKWVALFRRFCIRP